MIKYFLIGLVTLFSLVGGQNIDALINEAITLYETRHLNAANLEMSRDILQSVINKESKNLQANYELSKVFYLLGDRAQTKNEKLALYHEGMTFGKNAIKIDNNSAWAHFWYVVNLGRSGQTKGVLNSLSSVPEIKKETDKVLKIDPKHTGALDVKAMLYYELPGLLGGNLNKSIEALNRAIEMDSNYGLFYVDMGKVYIKKKDYEKARWYLNKVLTIQKPTFEADYVLDDQLDALKLLKEIEIK